MSAFSKSVKASPALVAGLANIAVVLGAKFGLHLNADQLVSAVVAATGLLAGATHVAVSKSPAPAPAPAPVPVPAPPAEAPKP